MRWVFCFKDRSHIQRIAVHHQVPGTVEVHPKQVTSGFKLSSLPVVIRYLLSACSQLRAVRILGKQPSLLINLVAGARHTALLMSRAISKGKTQKGSIYLGCLGTHPTPPLPTISHLDEDTM